jgi:hypothetical protein
MRDSPNRKYSIPATNRDFRVNESGKEKAREPVLPAEGQDFGANWPTGVERSTRQDIVSWQLSGAELFHDWQGNGMDTHVDRNRGRPEKCRSSLANSDWP